MSCGADDERFGADIRVLCHAVRDFGCFPLELALSSGRMRRAGLWAVEHLCEREEMNGECLEEIGEFLTGAAIDPEFEDAVAALRRRHPELRAPAAPPRLEPPARPPSRDRPGRP